jgi:hypothetical protein
MSDTIDLLGGAIRTRTRVRGFAPWQPQADTLKLLDDVRAVLDEYEDYLPLTIRQIFYRLVGTHAYEKTERAYRRLCENLNRARRARLISMAAIRDDGGTVKAPDNVWDSAKEFLATVREQARRIQLDRTLGQSTRLVVICEAAGMVPQLGRVANPYGVKVLSGGGFDSLTDKYNFAAELADHNCPTEVLHVGDHDPSGVNMFLAFLEDVEAFTRDLVCASFTRLAVTPAQIQQYSLPTAPPKDTDKRAFNGLTCQAEALAPDVLAQILRDAIESRIDLDVLNRVQQREKTIQRQLLKHLRG